MPLLPLAILTGGKLLVLVLGQIDLSVTAVMALAGVASASFIVTLAMRMAGSGAVGMCLSGKIPVVAASDYVCAYPGLIAPYLEGRFAALGTDGFGRSGTRQTLTEPFEVDRRHIVVAALHSLGDLAGAASVQTDEAINRYQLCREGRAPWLTWRCARCALVPRLTCGDKNPDCILRCSCFDLGRYTGSPCATLAKLVPHRYDGIPLRITTQVVAVGGDWSRDEKHEPNADAAA